MVQRKVQQVGSLRGINQRYLVSESFRDVVQYRKL